MKPAFIALLCATAVATVSGCAGNGANTSPAQSVISKQQVTIKVDVPVGSGGSSMLRHAQYVSQATTQMVVNVQTGCPGACVPVSGFPFTASLTPTSGGCTSSPSSTSCQITIALVPGNYFATLVTEDASGAALSAAQSIPFTIVAGTNNVIPVTLGGIPASVDFVPSLSSKLSAGSGGFAIGSCSSPQAADVLAADADGYYIVGPGAPAVSLSSSNTAVLSVAAVGPASPNAFTLSCTPIVPWNTSVRLTAATTPLPGSGAAPLSTNVDVAFFHAIAGTLTEFSGMTGCAGPRGIAPALDGALWFAEFCTDKIGRITTSGKIGEYAIPTVDSGPWGITSGPDGALWFAEYFANNIGRITTSGTITEFTVPTGASNPTRIVSGPDGALWFTESSGNNIGRVTTNGGFTEYPIPTAFAEAIGIAVGSDGALWFTESLANKIGRVTTSGTMTEFSVPTAGSQPWAIAPGPDGALWFTEMGATKIGRITTSGTFAEYNVPTAASGPRDITPGPDGALWFTEYYGNNVGRITTAGSVSEYAVPTAASFPFEITAGPDGAVWFTESESDKIGQLL